MCMKPDIDPVLQPHHGDLVALKYGVLAKSDD